MRFLFIVQGEGRGHMTQAISLQDILIRNGHEVVEVLVGKSPRREIPAFFIKELNAILKHMKVLIFWLARTTKRYCLQNQSFTT
ncbi:MAG: hypothetical protein HC830_06215 [Bacteroidetes bacterium]|nr:hypothetical protein [Bacteroidota bacterium]